MNVNDELILNYWASGKAGVSKRLARRAWLILCENNRVPPNKITEAWGSASEAQQWIKNFHSMGLVGLADQPRSGRTKKYTSISEESIRLAEANKKIDWKVGLGNLNKKEKESVWREARKTGAVLQRNRNGLNLPIKVPADLSDLVAVYLSREIQLIAVLDDSANRFQQLNGEWIQVEKAILKTSKNQAGTPDLISALKIKFKRNNEDQEKYERNRGKLETKIANQLIKKMSYLAEECPGRISICLICDVRSGNALVFWLNNFRSSNIWSFSKKSNPSNFKEVQVIGHQGSSALAMQHAMASILSPKMDSLGSLLDSVTLKRTDTFCWYRTNDGDPEKDESNWLKSDLDFDHE